MLDGENSLLLGMKDVWGEFEGSHLMRLLVWTESAAFPFGNGIAMKVGRCPRKSTNPIDSRGSLVSFRPNDFRLFEHLGPSLTNEAPLLARKVFGGRVRFLLGSLSPAEQKETEDLMTRILDLCELDHLQLKRSVTRSSAGVCKLPLRKCK